MSNDAGIDPRYAAQYQRGYDPARHDPTPPTPAADRRGPVRVEGGPPPTAQRVPDPPPLAARAPSATAAPAVAPPTQAETPTDEPAPRPRPRTEWAVLAAAVAQFAAAGWLFSRALDFARRYQGLGPTAEEQAEAIAANSLPGPLLLGGVVALCLWIVLRAVRPSGPS